MRSRAIKLDVQFAEAKACGRMDRPFAVTCLALLRQTCATHTQKELLLSIADSLEELIFSRVPSFEGARPRTPGASSGGEYEGLAWFELYKRAEEEKREEALAKEALLLERQQLLDEVAEVKREERAREAREAALVAREAEALAREDEARAVRADELAAFSLRELELRDSKERELETAAKRLAHTEGALLRAQTRLGVAERAISRRQESAAQASARLREVGSEVASPPPPPPHADTATRLQAQLRALQLQLLASIEPPAAAATGGGPAAVKAAATAAVAAKAAAEEAAAIARLCQVEADGCVVRGAIVSRGAAGGRGAAGAEGGSRPPDNPTAARHAARADEVQRVLAQYLLEQQPTSASDTAPAGSLMEQVLQERAALQGMR